MANFNTFLYDVTQNMVFHSVHVQTRGRHLDAMQACFLRAVPRRRVFYFVPSLTWGVVWTLLKRRGMRFKLTWHSLLLMWTLHYVAMCGVTNVLCDTKMSHE